MGKITARVVEYPNNQRPDIYVDEVVKLPNAEVEVVRYALGKKGKNMLVGICMNPSAATMLNSDRMVNKFIRISEDLGKDGWLVFNLYPERGTDSKSLARYSQELMNKNLSEVKRIITEKKVKEILLAWGCPGIDTIKSAEQAMLKMLSELTVSKPIQLKCLGSLTKRHPRYCSPQNSKHEDHLKNKSGTWDEKPIIIKKDERNNYYVTLENEP